MAIWGHPLTLEAIIIQLVLLVLTVIIKRRYFSPLRDIPGPFAASITRLWYVRSVIAGDQSTKLLALHRRLGPFVRVSHDEVSVGRPDAVSKILLAPLRKGPWYKCMCWPDWRFQTPMSTVDPKAKNERSRWLASGYANSSIIQSEIFISGQIMKLKGWMDQYAESSLPMHLDKFFSYCAYDIMGEVIFSKTFGFNDKGEDIGNSLGMNRSFNALVAWGAWYRWAFTIFLKNPLVTSLSILPLGHLVDTANRMLAERRYNTDARFDMIEHWLQNHRKHPDRISFRDIQAATAVAVGAGSDTISSAMQSFVYFMVRDPHEPWNRARGEIRKAQDRGFCNDPVVSFADAQDLLYLQACIKEAMRVFPPGQMGLVREAPAGGITIGDRTFPQGTLLSVNAYTIHHSKEIWGEDADVFRPDRWLEPGASSLDKYFIPWSAGINACPGKHLSKIEISKMAATIVRDYDIRLVDPQKEWEWEAYFNVVPHDWPVYIEKFNA